MSNSYVYIYEYTYIIMQATFDEKLASDHYVVNISNNIPLIHLFNQYIKLHPEFYKLDVNYRLIIAESDAADTTPLESRPVYTIYDEPVQFIDANHNAQGWLITDYVVETLQSGKVRCDYTFKIWIKREVGAESNRQYHVRIQEYMHKQARHGDRVTLNYYKILNEQLITHTFYDRKLSEWMGDVKQLKDEFFSPHKKYLFDVMTKVHRNGNWSNLILHGEPGTGKSSFVYRLATRLKMSIISVDLSMYIDRKRDLYSIFHGNEFSLPYGKGQKLTVSQNCIIILEEFDSAIEKIKQLENIFVFKSDTIHTYVENKTSEIGQKVQTASAPSATSLQMDVPLSDPFQYIASKQNAAGEPLDPLKITNEIFDIVRTITEDNKSDVLRLRDMLELFQGPVPVRDRIIVATTNNYEQIKNIIPALFRPGRLTPIKFTYLDATSFCELCQYYFGAVPTAAQIPVICIPTSQITELAIKYTSMAEAKCRNEPAVAFADFMHELIELNNATKQSNQASQLSLVSATHNTLASATALNGDPSHSEFTPKKILKRPVNSPPINTAPDLPQSGSGSSSGGSGAKVDMYSSWIDKKLGMIREEEPATSQESNAVIEVDSKQSAGEFPPTDALTKKKPKRRPDRNYTAGSNISTIAPRMPKPQTHSIQSVGVPLTQVPPAAPQHSEDDQIRNTVVEKVLANEKALRKKNPYYNPEELIHNYMQTAIVAPQHDDEY